MLFGGSASCAVGGSEKPRTVVKPIVERVVDARTTVSLQ